MPSQAEHVMLEYLHKTWPERSLQENMLISAMTTQEV